MPVTQISGNDKPARRGLVNLEPLVSLGGARFAAGRVTLAAIEDLPLAEDDWRP